MKSTPNRLKAVWSVFDNIKNKDREKMDIFIRNNKLNIDKFEGKNLLQILQENGMMSL